MDSFSQRSATLRGQTDTGSVAPTHAPNIGEEWPPFLILACLTLLFLAQIPSVPVGAQLLCILGGIGGLIATIAVCRGFAENIGHAALKAPSLFLLALTGYATYRFFTTPETFKLLATVDLLRVWGGSLAYFACAYILATSRQLGRLVVGIALFAVFVAFADFGKFGATGSKDDYFVHNTSVLGLHMTVGGFLAMLCPAIAAFAFLPDSGGDNDDRKRLVAQLTLLVVGFALILARSRSGWVAGVAALVVVAALLWRNAARERWRRGTEPARRRGEHPVARILNSPYLWVGAGLIVLVVGGGLSGVLNKRGADIAKVASGNLSEGATTVKTRLNSWRGALLMIHDKPVTGWGLGGYMVEQGKYTHTGDETIEVLRNGTGHQNRAHNYYLHWATDTGFIGLFLHGAFFAAWAFAVVRGLPVAPSPERRALAIGAVGAVVAGMVDAIASPMYQLHGTYALWLAWAGIGLAALRADPPRHGVSFAFSPDKESPATPDNQPAIASPTPWYDWLGAGAVGAVLCYACVFYIGRIENTGKRVPRGTFRVETLPFVTEVRPGTQILWRATFRDENGNDRATLPGTEWEVVAREDILRAPGAGFRRLDGRTGPGYDPKVQSHAGLQLVPPPGTQTPAITVYGVYRDDYGRKYRFASSVAIRQDAPEVEPYRFRSTK